MSELIPPKVPEGLRDMIKNLVKEILRKKPPNLYEFSAQFFDDLQNNSKKESFSTKKQLNESYEVHPRHKISTKIPLSLAWNLVPDKITCLIKDFIKAVLKKKPANLHTFALEYFRSLQNLKEGQISPIQYSAYENYLNETNRLLNALFSKCVCGRSLTSELLVKNDEKIKFVGVVHAVATHSQEMELSGKNICLENPKENNENHIPSTNNNIFSKEYIRAVCIIQKNFRGYIQRKKKIKNKKSISNNQIPTTTPTLEDSALKHNSSKMSMAAAALIIQRTVRNYISKKHKARDQNLKFENFIKNKKSTSNNQIPTTTPTVEDSELKHNSSKMSMAAAAFIIQRTVRNYIAKKHKARDQNLKFENFIKNKKSISNNQIPTTTPTVEDSELKHNSSKMSMAAAAFIIQRTVRNYIAKKHKARDQSLNHIKETLNDRTDSAANSNVPTQFSLGESIESNKDTIITSVSESGMDIKKQTHQYENQKTNYVTETGSLRNVLILSRNGKNKKIEKGTNQSKNDKDLSKTTKKLSDVELSGINYDCINENKLNINLNTAISEQVGETQKGSKEESLDQNISNEIKNLEMTKPAVLKNIIIDEVTVNFPDSGLTANIGTSNHQKINLEESLAEPKISDGITCTPTENSKFTSTNEGIKVNTYPYKTDNEISNVGDIIYTVPHKITEEYIEDINTPDKFNSNKYMNLKNIRSDINGSEKQTNTKKKSAEPIHLANKLCSKDPNNITMVGHKMTEGGNNSEKGNLATILHSEKLINKDGTQDGISFFNDKNNQEQNSTKPINSNNIENNPAEQIKNMIINESKQHPKEIGKESSNNPDKKSILTPDTDTEDSKTTSNKNIDGTAKENFKDFNKLKTISNETNEGGTNVETANVACEGTTNIDRTSTESEISNPQQHRQAKEIMDMAREESNKHPKDINRGSSIDLPQATNEDSKSTTSVDIDIENTQAERSSSKGNAYKDRTSAEPKNSDETDIKKNESTKNESTIESNKNYDGTAKESSKDSNQLKTITNETNEGGTNLKKSDIACEGTTNIDLTSAESGISNPKEHRHTKQIMDMAREESNDIVRGSSIDLPQATNEDSKSTTSVDIDIENTQAERSSSKGNAYKDRTSAEPKNSDETDIKKNESTKNESTIESNKNFDGTAKESSKDSNQLKTITNETNEGGTNLKKSDIACEGTTNIDLTSAESGISNPKEHRHTKQIMDMSREESNDIVRGSSIDLPQATNEDTKSTTSVDIDIENTQAERNSTKGNAYKDRTSAEPKNSDKTEIQKNESTKNESNKNFDGTAKENSKDSNQLKTTTNETNEDGTNLEKADIACEGTTNIDRTSTESGILNPNAKQIMDMAPEESNEHPKDIVRGSSNDLPQAINKDSKCTTSVDIDIENTQAERSSTKGNAYKDKTSAEPKNSDETEIKKTESTKNESTNESNKNFDATAKESSKDCNKLKTIANETNEGGTNFETANVACDGTTNIDRTSTESGILNPNAKQIMDMAPEESNEHPKDIVRGSSNDLPQAINKDSKCTTSVDIDIENTQAERSSTKGNTYKDRTSAEPKNSDETEIKKTESTKNESTNESNKNFDGTAKESSKDSNKLKTIANETNEGGTNFEAVNVACDGTTNIDRTSTESGILNPNAKQIMDMAPEESNEHPKDIVRGSSNDLPQAINKDSKCTTSVDIDIENTQAERSSSKGNAYKDRTSAEPKNSDETTNIDRTSTESGISNQKKHRHAKQIMDTSREESNDIVRGSSIDLPQATNEYSKSTTSVDIDIENTQAERSSSKGIAYKDRTSAEPKNSDETDIKKTESTKNKSTNESNKNFDGTAKESSKDSNQLKTITNETNEGGTNLEKADIVCEGTTNIDRTSTESGISNPNAKQIMDMAREESNKHPKDINRGSSIDLPQATNEDSKSTTSVDIYIENTQAERSSTKGNAYKDRTSAEPKNSDETEIKKTESTKNESTNESNKNFNGTAKESSKDSNQLKTITNETNEDGTNLKKSDIACEGTTNIDRTSTESGISNPKEHRHAKQIMDMSREESNDIVRGSSIDLPQATNEDSKSTTSVDIDIENTQAEKSSSKGIAYKDKTSAEPKNSDETEIKKNESTKDESTNESNKNFDETARESSKDSNKLSTITNETNEDGTNIETANIAAGSDSSKYIEIENVQANINSCEGKADIDGTSAESKNINKIEQIENMKRSEIMEEAVLSSVITNEGNAQAEQIKNVTTSANNEHLYENSKEPEKVNTGFFEKTEGVKIIGEIDTSIYNSEFKHINGIRKTQLQNMKKSIECKSTEYPENINLVALTDNNESMTERKERNTAIINYPKDEKSFSAPKHSVDIVSADIKMTSTNENSKCLKETVNESVNDRIVYTDKIDKTNNSCGEIIEPDCANIDDNGDGVPDYAKHSKHDDLLNIEVKSINGGSLRSIRKSSAVKWFGNKQNSLPVQIDFELFRVVPKHIRKRIKSAEIGNKFHNSF